MNIYRADLRSGINDTNELFFIAKNVDEAVGQANNCLSEINKHQTFEWVIENIIFIGELTG